jgi:type I restriction enzyme S subunit
VFHFLKGCKDNLFYFTQTAIPQITVDEVGSNPILIPPLSEQTQIAAFLDRETAKIDELVTEQRRLMELLKEKRQAVISHAVTQGLNPDALMKPSGIEWLGDVPAHWRVMPLGRVTISRCDGPFGSGLKSEHYTDSGVRVIRLQNIRRDGFNGADEAFIDVGYYESELTGHDVIRGDVLIAGLGDDKNTVGRACVAPVGIEPAMVKADCFRYRLDISQVFPVYIATQLSTSSAADAGVLSSGSTRSRIPLSVMATRKLAVPPISEQSAIANFLAAETAKFDTLTAEAQRAIDLLQERRTALISAAVTGQIDVRGVCA